ncbi:MAG: hypothetical protein WAU70_15835 [Flavobacteriales bacterium]
MQKQNIVMQHQPISKVLCSHLDEINFVYRSLPGALERVEAITPTKNWRTFFHRQASLLREQQTTLRETVAAWGQRLRPCICDDVTERLNEVRYALAARPETPILERTVLGVLNDLRALVVKHLEDAAHLAMRIGEKDLSKGLQDLLSSERAQVIAREEPWRK